MTGTIFFRERRLGEPDGKQPRFQVVATAGIDLRFYGKHLRISELEAIAQAIEANLVELPPASETPTPEEMIAGWLAPAADES